MVPNPLLLAPFLYVAWHHVLLLVDERHPTSRLDQTIHNCHEFEWEADKVCDEDRP